MNEEVMAYITEEAASIRKLTNDLRTKNDQLEADLESGNIDVNEYEQSIYELTNGWRRISVRLKFLIANLETTCDVPTELVDWMRTLLANTDKMLEMLE